MKFRAILDTPRKLERSIQVFGNDLERMRDWGKEIVERYPEGLVRIFETKEDLVEIVLPEKLEKRKKRGAY